LEVKNEAVLLAETLDGNEPDKAAEEAYYGYQGRNGNQKNQGQIPKVKVKLGNITTSRHKRRPGRETCGNPRLHRLDIANRVNQINQTG